MTNPHREKTRLQWVRTVLNDSDLKLRPASSDASFRSYLRTECRGSSFVIMDAPPEKEDIGPWLDVAVRLRGASLSAPEVMWVNREDGFILMSDLGDTPFLDVLNADSVAELYRDAINAIFTMQSRIKPRGLPDYDATRLQAELDLFPEWFLEHHLGLRISASEKMIIGQVFKKLVDSALEQPQVFVHRDFHSRNLMKLRGGNPGIIDFQDAVCGPITYDLVSLLRDCYIEWPQERVLAWVNEYRDRLSKNGMIEDRELRFKRWFDWMGLQRHLKVLGIFCRLCYRDGKERYLKDLPLTLKYVLDVASRNKDMGPFAEWLRDKVGSTDITMPRTLP
jgi:N-acetylmuramate 1-kinase